MVMHVHWSVCDDIVVRCLHWDAPHVFVGCFRVFYHCRTSVVIMSDSCKYAWHHNIRSITVLHTESRLRVWNNRCLHCHAIRNWTNVITGERLTRVAIRLFKSSASPSKMKKSRALTSTMFWLHVMRTDTVLVPRIAICSTLWNQTCKSCKPQAKSDI